MSDLTDKQWDEYLAKDKRMILHRAHASIASATADLVITDNKDLKDMLSPVILALEERLKKLYGEANDETVHA
jgi:hypothetical protein